jgi:tRNA/rRNA methyltransferase
MSFWTYILRCSNGIYYTGHTDDIDRRIAEHQSGAIKGYTHDKRPVELMWAEEFLTRAEALEAELRVKNWSRAKKEGLIAGNWSAVSDAAVPPGERASRVSASLDRAPRLRSGRTDEEGTALSSPALQGQSPHVEGNPDTLMADHQTSARPPAIVLVRPQLGENIGKAARAMLNFGLTDLRLVSPRDGWPNPAAGPAASGADIVLQHARVFDTVADAVADCAHVYATTVRKRGLVVPVVTPEEAAREIRALPEPTAILFGAERSGLETDEVAIAQKILTVPINPEFRSLNLAQAVILIAYEWSKQGNVVVPTEGDPQEPRAPHGHLEGLIGQVNEALDEVGYFFPPDRTPTTLHSIRTILTKPGWSTREIQALRGMIRAITHPRQRGRSSNLPNS